VVEGDAARIEQIVANLVANSMKFAAPGGRIDIGVEESDGSVIVRVRDDGLGIPPEMLDEIFDLFTQAHADLARQRGGLGLGLTLVRTLTQLHGGEVSATSPGPGRGSEFVVRLPLAPLAPLEAPAGTSPLAGVARLRLLVVEDNEDNCESLRDLLELAGHEVATASDGLGGVERAVALEPDVAFIDIGLPGIDGYEVARRVRARLGSSVYLVALTGYGQPEDRQRAVDAGFDLHVTKPPDIDRLHEILSRRRPADHRASQRH
jgi:CheY-like chemotaxis protein